MQTSAPENHDDLRVALRALHAADEELSRALRVRCGLSRVATRGWLLGVFVHDAVAVLREDTSLTGGRMWL